MAGVTATLLGNLDTRREFGKVGTQSDLHLHDFKENDRDVTVLLPARYPEQLKCLSYSVLGADTAVIVINELNAQIGEQILACDAAGITHGAIVLQNYLQPEQIAPLLKGTSLESWKVFVEEDWPGVRMHLAECPETDPEGFVMVPIDHHFDVKGVGAVILGVVTQGILKKSDTLYAWPTKTICPVKSIQVHDVDQTEAVTGDRVGLALRNVKADMLDRGMILAPSDADLSAFKANDEIEFTLARGAFSKQPLNEGAVVHLGVGMQFVPGRLLQDAPGAGEEGKVRGVLEKGLVVKAGDRGVIWHVDAAQRVVGSAKF